MTGLRTEMISSSFLVDIEYPSLSGRALTGAPFLIFSLEFEAERVGRAFQVAHHPIANPFAAAVTEMRCPSAAVPLAHAVGGGRGRWFKERHELLGLHREPQFPPTTARWAHGRPEPEA